MLVESQHNASMNSIKIKFSPADGDPLIGQSKWWGMPDMPEDLVYPMIPYDDGDDDPMTFVCQIRCSELAAFDPDNLLPHEGMLYFFAAIDEYLPGLESCESDYHNGMGEWSKEMFRVLYSPSSEDLKPHTILDEDGLPYGLPAERIQFEAADYNYESFKLLGRPYYDEIQELFPDYLNLLQIDESDEWLLRFYDCGMICFLIRPEDLRAGLFSNVIVYFHSF